MLFSDLYKSTKSPLSRLRSSNPVPIPGPDFDADLLSKDKTKQKEAVRKYLAARIRNDWDFRWPQDGESLGKFDSHTGLPTPPPERASHESPHIPLKVVLAGGCDDPRVDLIEANDDGELSDAGSTYSTISEDTAHYQSRVDWLSELSDNDDPISPSAYRFDNPEAVGPAVQATAAARQAKRRRAERAEEASNPGLACFNARRDAWTGARTVRVKAKPESPLASPAPSSRRLSFWRLSSPTSPNPLSAAIPPVASPTFALSPTTTHDPAQGDSAVLSSSDADSSSKDAGPTRRNRGDTSHLPVQTLVPLAPPLLPPANPMRASITPAVYTSIYDKIVLQSMTPACPINLSDVIRSCVVGWKRDGEWPPRSADMSAQVLAVRRKKEKRGSNASTGRRMSFNFLGRWESATGDGATTTANHAAARDDAAGQAKDDEATGTGKGIRRSLQRVLGIGHERTSSSTSQHGTAAAM